MLQSVNLGVLFLNVLYLEFQQEEVLTFYMLLAEVTYHY